MKLSCVVNSPTLARVLMELAEKNHMICLNVYSSERNVFVIDEDKTIWAGKDSYYDSNYPKYTIENIVEKLEKFEREIQVTDILTIKQVDDKIQIQFCFGEIIASIFRKDVDKLIAALNKLK